MKKKIISLSMTFFVLFSVLYGAKLPARADNPSKNIYRNDSKYLIQKISNPYTISGEADGLENETDRENSYAWSMGELKDEYGDYIYIGSNRNLLYAALSSVFPTYGDPALLKSLVDTITNGELETNTSPASFRQASIVRYNLKTNTMETFLDSADYPDGVYSNISGFRACTSFKNELYFNAINVSNSMIWRVSSNNVKEPEVVFNQPGGFMRAMTVSNDGNTMYVGGTDKSFGDVLDETIKFNINIYSTTDGKIYEPIADYKDFTHYEKDGYFSAGGDVWDIVEYNGSLYLTLMTLHGAIVYEAHKASESEMGQANEYGWVWTDIVGETENSIYAPGFGNHLNYTATPYIFNGDLYFITFSNAMDSLIQGAYGLFSMLKSETPDMQIFFNSLKMMEENMNNESSVFRLTSEGKMQMVVGDKESCPPNIEYLAKAKAGFNDDDYSTTQYNGRAAVYDGKLYIGTLDAYSIYKYLTKLTNGDLFQMNDEEFRQQLEYSIEFLTLISNNKNSTDNNINTYSDEFSDVELAATLYNSFMKPDVEIESFSELDLLLDKESEPRININGNNLSNEEIDTLINFLVYINSKIDGEATTEAVSKILNSINIHEGRIEIIAESMDAIIEKLNDWKDSLPEDDYNQSIDALINVLNSMKSVLDVFKNVNQEGIDRYVRVSDTIAANKNPGFELYCTEDGINYDTLTIDGFNDEYNYGCRTLLSGNDGLYLGTANPFYGAQLWRINEKTSDLKTFTSNIEEINNAFNKATKEYAANVSYDIKEFKFTLIPADPGNTIYLNGIALEGWEGTAQLDVGKNVITIENENIDSSEKTTYSFAITRAEEDKKPDTPEKPNNPDTPNSPENPNKPDNPKEDNKPPVSPKNPTKEKPTSPSKNNPKTGDYTNILLYASLMIVSGILILTVINRKKPLNK